MLLSQKVRRKIASKHFTSSDSSFHLLFFQETSGLGIHQEGRVRYHLRYFTETGRGQKASLDKEIEKKENARKTQKKKKQEKTKTKEQEKSSLKKRRKVGLKNILRKGRQLLTLSLIALCFIDLPFGFPSLSSLPTGIPDH